MNTVSRVAKAVGPGALAFITYIIFSGSLSGYDITTGVIVGVVVGVLVANISVENPRKLAEVWRIGWGIAYAVVYFLYSEVKSHLDVMRRILSPSMPINPGIVRVPYEVKSDYAITAVANSITNTPGTVVVDIYPEGKSYFVHWIDVKTKEPQECREAISALFEKFSRKVFD